MRTDVLLDVNWEGRETEDGNTIYGWHLGTVCVKETQLDDGELRYEVYVAHQPGDVVVHWSVFATLEKARARHDQLIVQLREVGEHGLFARQFESRSELPPQ